MHTARRYQIELNPDRSRYAIYDNVLDGYCTLPDPQTRALMPLEWNSPHAATAWLQRCAQLWSAGAVPAPRNWNTWRPPTTSPWANLPFVDCAICGGGTFDFTPIALQGRWANACPRCAKARAAKSPS